MRLRVGSQFATIMIFVGYAGWNAFTLDLAPGMAVPSEQLGGIKKREREWKWLTVWLGNNWGDVMKMLSELV
jgi:hypothetical protein